MKVKFTQDKTCFLPDGGILNGRAGSEYDLPDPIAEILLKNNFAIKSKIELKQETKKQKEILEVITKEEPELEVTEKRRGRPAKNKE